MASQYLSEEDNLADLIDRIPGRDREVFKEFRCLTLQAAFDDRVFVVYQPQGLTERNEHRDPKILATLRVIDLACRSGEGCYVRLVNQDTGEEMALDYIPQRVFGFDVFMSIPPKMSLRWDGRVLEGRGAIRRSMSYPLLVKTRNRSDWYSAGVTYCESPNGFRKLFPKSNLTFI